MRCCFKGLQRSPVGICSPLSEALHERGKELISLPRRVGLEVGGGTAVGTRRQHRAIEPAAGNERFGVEQERVHREGAGGHVGAVCRGWRAKWKQLPQPLPCGLQEADKGHCLCSERAVRPGSGQRGGMEEDT